MSWRSCTPRASGPASTIPAIHLFALYRRMGWKEGDFPHAEYAGRNILTLPLFPRWPASDVARVVRALASVLGGPTAKHERRPEISVVIPVYNEEPNLPLLFSRLYPVLDGLGRKYEVIFTNDGSADRSLELLRRPARGPARRHPGHRLQRQLRPAHGGHGRLRARPRPGRRDARRRPAEPARGDSQASRR